MVSPGREGSPISVWSHVNGSIRIDGIITAPEVDNSLFDNSDWYSTPSGSEGPLRVHTRLVGSGMVYYDTQITGDLRNYDETESIIAWIRKVTKDLMIRSGVLEVETEGKEKVVLIYDQDKTDWIEIYRKELT